MAYIKKADRIANQLGEAPSEVNETQAPQSKTKVEVEKATLEKLLSKVESLEKKDEENQKQLKMLYAVADKGRLFNYENSNAEKKSSKVYLSKYEDKLVVGWRTLKDRLIKNPTTGLTVGEEQEYELLLLDDKDEMTKIEISSYSRFSDIRYGERIECEVIGRKEDYAGNITFELSLPGGRNLSIDGKFIN